MRRNLAVLLVVVCGAVVLAACTTAAPTAAGSPGSTSTGHATSAAPSTAPTPATAPTPGAAPCTAHDLRALGGGRQGGGFQTAAALVQVENVGPTECVLAQAPSALSLVGAGGTATALAVTYRVGSARTALSLRPGAVAEADLNWANWCHGDLGPLRVRLTFPGGAGTVESPFDGPPDYDYVPGCTASGRPSTVTFLGWLAVPPG